MKLFESIQRVVEVGKVTKVVVPASFAVILDNKTDATVLFYESQYSKVGFPLASGATWELERIPEPSETWVEIEETEIKENQGLFVVVRPYLDVEKPEENNTVIMNQKS